MPSTYTSLLRLTLPADGELIGTWGQVVNNGITSLEETAIAGTGNIVMADANKTLTTANGAADEARNMTLKFTGAITAQRDVIVPSSSKIYFIRNNTTGGFGLQVKTAAGTGVVVGNNQAMLLWCDGSNVSTALTTVVGAGQSLIADGTVGAPGLAFTNDPDTGMYRIGLDDFGFALGGVRNARFYASNFVQGLDPTTATLGQVIAVGNNLNTGTASSNSTLVAESVNRNANVQLRYGAAGSAGYQWYDLAAAVRAQFNLDASNNLVFSSNPNVVRFTIAVADGGARFTGLVAATNIYVAETAAGAGTVGIPTGSGPATIYWGNSSAGAGRMELYANGTPHVAVGGVVAVNYWTMMGGATTVRPSLTATGADTNIGLAFTTKGTGDVVFFYGAGGITLQTIAGGATWIQIGGATGVAPNYPVVQSNAAKITMNNAVRFTGGLTTAGDLATRYSQTSNTGFSMVDPTRAANAKVAELIFDGGSMQLRYLNDLNNDVRYAQLLYGDATNGVSTQNFYTGANELTFQIVTLGAGFGRVSVGSLAPKAQLEVAGLGQANSIVFDPDFAAGGGAIYLTDTGTGAGNGGCIMFGAFATTGSLNGKHFASIKAYITDASANTAGELYFNLKATSADTGSTPVLRLTAARGIYDYANRELGLRNLIDGGSPGSGTTIPITAAGAVITSTVGTLNLSGVTGWGRGMVITILNAFGASMTLTSSDGMVLKLGGTATTGTRTIANIGLCTIYIDHGTSAVVCGAGVT